MDNPLISVIVPIYNVEKYINRCINSIINQTYKNMEIILVDDGSPDNCPMICDEYSKKDKRIKVIHKKNEGVSRARNDAIKIAKGEWLMFVDADDIVNKEAVNILINNYQDYELIIGDIILFEGDVNNDIEYEEPRNKLVIDDSNKQVLYYNSFSGKNGGLFNGASQCAKLYKMSLIKSYNMLYDENMAVYEDLFFNFKFYEKSNKIIYVNIPVYYYRQDNMASASTRFDCDLSDKCLYFVDALNINFKSIIEQYKQDYYDFLLLLLKSNIVKNVFNSENKISYFKRVSNLEKVTNSSYYRDCINNVDVSLIGKGRRALVFIIKYKFYFLLYIFKKFYRK